MRIAMPIWEGRVSPVFDTATVLLVVEHDGRQEVGRRTETLGGLPALRRVGRLVELGVQALVCGAISRPLLSMISGRGIQVLPFISGNVEDVLTAYVSGGLGIAKCPARFRMPGCCGRRGRFGGGRRGRRGHG